MGKVSGGEGPGLKWGEKEKGRIVSIKVSRLLIVFNSCIVSLEPASYVMAAGGPWHFCVTGPTLNYSGPVPSE